MKNQQGINRDDFKELHTMYQNDHQTDEAFHRALQEFDKTLADTEPVTPHRFPTRKVGVMALAAAASIGMVFALGSQMFDRDVAVQPATTAGPTSPLPTKTQLSTEGPTTSSGPTAGTSTSNVTPTPSLPGSQTPTGVKVSAPSIPTNPRQTKLVATAPTLIEPPSQNLVKGASWTIAGKNEGTFTPAPLNVSRWSSVPKGATSVTIAITGSDKKIAESLEISGSGVGVTEQWVAKTGKDFSPHLVFKVSLTGQSTPKITGSFDGSFTVHLVSYETPKKSGAIDLRKLSGYNAHINFGDSKCQFSPSGEVSCDRSSVTEHLTPAKDDSCAGKTADVVTLTKTGGAQFACHGHILGARDSWLTVPQGTAVYGPSGLVCLSDSAGLTCGYRGATTAMRISKTEMTVTRADGTSEEFLK